jgi:hypothetical protein
LTDEVEDVGSDGLLFDGTLYRRDGQDREQRGDRFYRHGTLRESCEQRPVQIGQFSTHVNGAPLANLSQKARPREPPTTTSHASLETIGFSERPPCRCSTPPNGATLSPGIAQDADHRYRSVVSTHPLNA